MALSSPTTDTQPHAGGHPRSEVVRCACAVCGAHANAVRSPTRRITGTCSNCGSLDLSPIDGAEPLGAPPA